MRKYFKNCETQEDVKRVYRQLCMKLHPDNNPDHDTTREFQDMQEEFRQVFEEVKTSTALHPVTLTLKKRTKLQMISWKSLKSFRRCTALRLN